MYKFFLDGEVRFKIPEGKDFFSTFGVLLLKLIISQKNTVSTVLFHQTTVKQEYC